MSNAKNRKLCWNCDGSVHIHATKCPYCGTDLVAEEGASYQSVAPSQPEPVAPPPPPPQSVRDEQAPPPPYVQRVQPQNYALPPQSAWQPPEEPKGQPEPESEEQEEPAAPRSRFEAMPLLLLLPGAFFFLFGMILLLFAEDGVLTLQWKARYWTTYLIISVPLLYFGWRSLNRVSTESA